MLISSDNLRCEIVPPRIWSNHPITSSLDKNIFSIKNDIYTMNLLLELNLLRQRLLEKKTLLQILKIESERLNQELSNLERQTSQQFGY